MTDRRKDSDSRPRNEGEGNRTAARAYNKDQEQFARSGKVEDAAKEAKRALDGEEGESLRRAEREGRNHAHERDPAVVRDYERKQD